MPKIVKNESKVTVCNNCNPKVYLNFNFAYIDYEDDCPNPNDIIKLYERMKFCSTEPYLTLKYKYSGNKQVFFETIPTNKIKWKHKKEIPKKFREQFPIETNEKFDILRVYPAGTPTGTSNPRIIGMIKNHIFYIFFIDWKGILYNH